MALVVDMGNTASTSYCLYVVEYIKELREALE